MSESAQPQATTLPDSHRWWRDLRDAARGTRHDYTSGDIGRAIFLLAVPMVLEMIMEGLFAVADVFWVGRLGSDAVATVGLTETMMIIVYTVGIGLSISGAAYVARRVGEKNHDGAARGTVQAIILGAAVSSVMALAGALLAPQLLAIMGASPAVIESGSGFTRVMLGGSSTAFMLFIINSTFRGAGDAAVAMRVLWLANWINIVLSPLLIFGVGPFPMMGVKGAAVGTTIGRGIGVLFALTRLARGSGHLAVKRAHLTFEWGTMWSLIKMSANATVQFTVSTVSWIGLVRVMAEFGSVAMAGYTIAVRIMMLALMPAFGLSSAGATMVGQALGAQDPERAATAVKTAARYNVMFLGTVGVLFLVGAPWFIAAFTRDPAVRDVATFGLRTMALGFPMFAFGMVYTQAFNGAGDTWTPTYLNIFVFWLLEIPLAWVLARHTQAGYRGIFIAVAVAYSVLAVVSRALFARGRWRTRVM
jgi:putative MATE family efflux protein